MIQWLEIFGDGQRAVEFQTRKIPDSNPPETRVSGERNPGQDFGFLTLVFRMNQLHDAAVPLQDDGQFEILWQGSENPKVIGFRNFDLFLLPAAEKPVARLFLVDEMQGGLDPTQANSVKFFARTVFPFDFYLFPDILDEMTGGRKEQHERFVL